MNIQSDFFSIGCKFCDGSALYLWLMMRLQAALFDVRHIHIYIHMRSPAVRSLVREKKLPQMRSSVVGESSFVFFLPTRL